jgi:hypothetical protein
MPHLDPHARVILVFEMIIPSHEKPAVEMRNVWQRAKGSEARIKAAAIHGDTDRALRQRRRERARAEIRRCVAEVGGPCRGCGDGLCFRGVQRGQRREQQGGE